MLIKVFELFITSLDFDIWFSAPDGEVVTDISNLECTFQFENV